jgi:subtilisin family serine protease
MHSGGHDIFRRYVRVAAIGLAILGMLALGHDHARAQLGVDLLRQAVEKVKGKGKGKNIPGKDLLKGKRQQKGPVGADAVKGRLKDKGGFDKSARDRLPKDRLTKDRLPKDRFSKDRVGKDRLTKDGKDKGIRDRFGKGKDGAKDKNIAKSKDAGKNKGIAKDKSSAKDRLAKDKAGKDKLSKNRPGLDKTGKGRLDNSKSARSKNLPDRRPARRFAQAKTPLARGKARSVHRRDITVARLRLPPRPFPGTAGFTGVPPAGETRFLSTEMVFHAGPNVSRQAVEAAAARHNMVVISAQPSAITGGTVYICRVPAGVPVATAVRAMEGERVGIASPNYVYRITQDPAAETATPAGSPDQYVIEKLNLAEVHKVTTGRNILVAVIDSQVDASHPDLAGAIAEEYDAVGKQETAHSHGTGMTGAIVSHRKLLGIAPNARILAVHAFSTTTRQTPEATTRQIISGIEWAINKGARVINMSFAGPYDPMLQLAMRNAAAKGVILIAASGNMGPRSPPLYPAADPHVIAVTAIDESDALFPQAVRGPHLAVAAPGVDVMVPAPNDSYQLTTGTSVAAAHVSGVAALLLERYPEADAATVLEVLTATARNLDPKGRDDLYGWGLVDPAAALQELDSRIADGKSIASSKSSAPKSASSKSGAPKSAAAKPAVPKSPNPGVRPTPASAQ